MIEPEELVRSAKALLRRIQSHIESDIENSPQIALRAETDPDKDPHNQPLHIDKYAEDACRIALERHFAPRLRAIGEETIAKEPEFKDLKDSASVFALMDIIDGTDLLLRNLSNWCSAVVFFYPPEARILASVVCDHSRNLFFATDKGAFFQPEKENTAQRLEPSSSPTDLRDACIRFIKGRPSGPSRTEILGQASVCFYGQKPPNFLSAYKNKFRNTLKTLSRELAKKTRPSPAFRLYNLGGIPMMMKVANGTIDAVFDLTNPKPHDSVPGAYIALKAGAYLGDLRGNAISVEQLGAYLLRPDDPGPAYVLAGTEKLYMQLYERLAS